MEQVFAICQENREKLKDFLTSLDKDTLFTVPEGFNNNIWWNIAHTVVTEQLLIYKLSGTPMQISDTLVAKYRKGTFPEENPTEDEFNEVLELLTTLPKRTLEDYKNGVFSTYNAYQTSFGFELTSVEDAISFNNFHEGMHFGYILALKRAIQPNS
ncbi:DinB family protein [Croceivirga sp. JEA036]|uniref:DinB family protein n=1 Tax=Croceivirga sp. JEA036 TaxID=2721162 RepID=UPI00143ACA59|nr:DinB family protein [Croceivirga sp. JEA036]NJB36887.1 DinB family protein [Croceivirga sp. JEA036]